jgi:hypothetical protein
MRYAVPDSSQTSSRTLPAMARSTSGSPPTNCPTSPSCKPTRPTTRPRGSTAKSTSPRSGPRPWLSSRSRAVMAVPMAAGVSAVRRVAVTISDTRLASEASGPRSSRRVRASRRRNSSTMRRSPSTIAATSLARSWSYVLRARVIAAIEAPATSASNTIQNRENNIADRSASAQ